LGKHVLPFTEYECNIVFGLGVIFKMACNAKLTRFSIIYSLILAYVLFFSAVHVLYASPQAVAFVRLASKDVSPALARTINEVIFSFTAEMKNYSVKDAGNADETVAIASDDILYIFTGRIVAGDGFVRLEVCFKNKELEMVRYLAKDYESTAKILLESRLLVKELFELQDSVEKARLSFERAEKTAPQQKENIRDLKSLVEEEFDKIFSLDSLVGAWYGEDGEVEKIMIMRGGRGVAIWASGISLLLDVKLEDGILTISQKGVPQPRQFVNLPDNIANIAAKSAKPIVWQFSVDQDLKVLSGLKRMSAVQYANDKIVSISEVSVPTVWHRN